MLKDARDLEIASRLSSVLFDKTGTLTQGALEVVRLEPVGAQDPTELLRLAGLGDLQPEPCRRSLGWRRLFWKWCLTTTIKIIIFFFYKNFYKHNLFRSRL